MWFKAVHDSTNLRLLSVLCEKNKTGLDMFHFSSAVLHSITSDSCQSIHPSFPQSAQRASLCDDVFKLCVRVGSVSLIQEKRETWPCARQRGNSAHPCYIRCQPWTQVDASVTNKEQTSACCVVCHEVKFNGTFVSGKHWSNWFYIFI